MNKIKDYLDNLKKKSCIEKKGKKKSKDSIMYFNDYNSLINYKLPCRSSCYMNIITNINNFGSLIDNDPLRGVNGIVYAIVSDDLNGILYIGGDFTMAGNTIASNIVSYNIKTCKFVPLIELGTTNEGTNNIVQCLAYDSLNSKLYFGGNFTMVCSTIKASHIASWDVKTNKFSALTILDTIYEGADDVVICLSLDSKNSILYFGGEIGFIGMNIKNEGIIKATKIASWDIKNKNLSALKDLNTDSEGASNSVYSLTIDSISNILYIGGAFTEVGGSIEANYICSWDNANSKFAGLNDLETGINGTNGLVYCVAFNPVKNIVYVGGKFVLAGGKMSQFISSYEINNLCWNNLEGGIQQLDDILKPIVNTLYLDINNQILYTGGNYLQSSGINTNNVSVYNIKNKLWTPLVENKGRYNGITNGLTYANENFVKSIYKLTDCLFIGGEFNMGGNIPVNNITKVKLNYIFNTDNRKIFLNNTSTILKYNSNNNKWNVIY